MSSSVERCRRNRLLARPISLAETEIGCWMPTPRFLSPRLALYWEKGKKEQVPAHAVFVYYCV